MLRIDLSITGGKPPLETGRTIIGSGFPERTDPMALVIGPTGVGLGADGTLYVADTLGNRIAAISNAATLTSGGTVTTLIGGGGLTGPLGLAIAPNGNILTVNSGDGNMVETTPKGVQVNREVRGSERASRGGRSIRTCDPGEHGRRIFRK